MNEPIKRPFLWDWAIATLLVATVFVLAIFPVASFDLFLHLSLGKVQFNQGRMLSEEVFSHTRSGLPWYNHEWLSSIVFYLVYKLAGYNGLIFLKAAIVSLSSLLIVRILKNRSYSYSIISPLILFMVIASIFRYEERPDLFTHLFLVLLYLIIDNQIKKANGYVPLISIFLIAIVWSNLHSAVIFGTLLVASFIMGETIKYMFRAKTINPIFALKYEKIKKLLLSLVVFIIGSLINPYGTRPYSQFLPSSPSLPFDNKGGIDIKGVLVDYTRTMGAEFLPPSLSGFPLFWISLGVMALLILFYFRKIDITELVILIPFTLLALRFNRAIGMYNIVAVPVLASLLSEFVRGKRDRKILLSFALLLLLVIAMNIKFFEENGRYRLGLGLNSYFFPVDSVQFIKSNKISGNMYNTEQIGGYLEWVLYPEKKVFYDTRTEVFSGLYGEMHNSGFLENYGVDYALVSTSRFPERLLFNERNWALVFWDRSSFVYLKRAPRNLDLIDRYEIRYFHPLAPAGVLLKSAKEDRAVDRLIAEIENHLKYVDNYDALKLLLSLYEERGSKKGREKQAFLVDALKRWPESVDINLGLAGNYYEEGDIENAGRSYESVLRYDKDNLTAHINLGFIFYDKGLLDKAKSSFEKCIRYNKDIYIPYYGLALVSEKKGEIGAAIGYLNQSLKAVPEGEWKDIVRKKLERLKRS